MIGADAPPASETRWSGAVLPGENTMTPLEFQLPPLADGASHRLTGGPPVASTFFSFPWEKKPTKSELGDQKGEVGSVGPGQHASLGSVHLANM